MRVGIIGGGLMGLALAERLASSGHSVSVYERDAQPGGLATWHDFGRFVWDRFYHVILPTDGALVEFLTRLGLGNAIRWGTTRTGYYVDQQFYSLSNGVDFLRFPPLGLWSKFRLGLTVFYCSRIRDWRRLEQMTVEDFLVRTSGRATFEKFWKPLLLAKLGQHYRRVSAVFIWTYINRLYSARDAVAQKEQLGYVSGGYRRVIQLITERITQSNGALHTGVEVQAVRPAGPAGIEVVADGHVERFDKVIFTGPVDAMRKVTAPELVEIPPPADVEYLGVICVAVVTRKPLVPFYVLNIADERIPFTGVIGMSTVVATEETGGLYLNYLPKYVLSDDPLLRRSVDELREIFMLGFREMFPGFNPEDIEAIHVNRAFRVQPLQVLNYSQRVQSTKTLHPDFYVVNTAQFVNSTLNNNEVIKAVNTFIQKFGAQFAAARQMSGPLSASAVA
jgi:protoporphyrinogen oxidase